MFNFLQQSFDNEYAMVGFRLDNTLSDFGRVARGVCKTDQEGYLESIVELTSIERKRDQIIYTGETGGIETLSGEEVVSMNIWGFHPGVFDPLHDSFSAFLKRESLNPKSEYYIPSLIYELIEKKRATVKVLESTDSWFGVTYREDKPDVIERIQKLVDAGVYPVSLY
jgi:hypothetical protein